MTLREEFEPVLISPDGLEPDAASCAASWNRETSSDERLEAMIALVDEWLAECTKSSRINKRVPSSFGLKNICSRWHGKNGWGPKILNGPFLMACHRRGYRMEAQPPRFVGKIQRNDANAWISISHWPDDGSRRPGTFTKENRV
jgi:hypothetical protein